MQEKLDGYIHEVMALYGLFTAGLFGTMSLSLLEGQQPALFSHKIAALTSASARDIRGYLEGYLDDAMGERLEYIMRDYENNPLTQRQMVVMDEFVEEQVNFGIERLMSQLNIDRLSILTEYKRFGVKVHMKRLDGIPGREARSEVMNDLPSNPQLFRRDVSGKQWKADVFFETELNVLFYQLINISTVYLLIMLGQDKGRITRPGHPLDDTLFELDDYEELQPMIFHPNSQAIVIPV